MDYGASSYRRFLNGEESAIDVFSDLIVNRHRYNFKVTLKTYLFMLGRSRALNYIKHRKVIEFVEFTEAAKVIKKNRKQIDNLALYVAYYEGIQYPVVKIIRSVDELNIYYKENKDTYDLEHREEIYSGSTAGFLDVCDKYDEAYFDDRILVITRR